MQMETEKALLTQYENVIDRLFKGDEWFASKGYSSWSQVDAKIRNKRAELEKEAYQLQEVLHKHLNIKRCG